jgi:uncharacterized protein DUF3105
VPIPPDDRRLVIRAGVLVVAIALTALAGCGGSDDSDNGTAPTTLAPDMSEIQTFTGLTRLHVAGPVQYAQTPPVGGDHAPVWQNCGFYREPVASEMAVHSLEHGAVWVTYSPDLPAAQLDILRDLAADQTYVLVSPYPGLPTPVVASAWGRQLRLPSAGDRRLREFVNRYRGSSDAPEPGAPCSGAAGTPES